jgi:hypothetical protein
LSFKKKTHLSIIWLIKSRRMRWAGHMARMGDRTSAYRILVGRLERKIPLGKPRRRWEDNIKWTFKKWDCRHGRDGLGSE